MTQMCVKFPLINNAPYNAGISFKKNLGTQATSIIFITQLIPSKLGIELHQGDIISVKTVDCLPLYRPVAILFHLQLVWELLTHIL